MDVAGMNLCPGRPAMDDDAENWPVCTECGRTVKTPTGRHLPNPPPKI